MAATPLFLFHVTPGPGAEGDALEFGAGAGLAIDQTLATWTADTLDYESPASFPSPKFGALCFRATLGGGVTFSRDTVQSDPSVLDSIPMGSNTCLTIDTWANVSSGDEGIFSIKVGGSDPDNFFLNVDETGILVEMSGGGLSIFGVLPTDDWVHLRVTYDGSILRLFVNGALEASSAATPGLLATINPISTMEINAQNFNGGGVAWDEAYAELNTSCSVANFTPPTAAWSLIPIPTGTTGGTGIRFPPDLRIPDRKGFTDSFEEIRSQFEPETGPKRRRNTMRRAPRLFDLTIPLDQTHFKIFDQWWQNTIYGGERPFDIQLIDGDETVVWFTVNVIGEYSAECDPIGNWVVQFKVRSIGDFFNNRESGTDELRGISTIGIASASGALQVTKPMRGLVTIGIDSTFGRLTLPGLYSEITIGVLNAKARMGPIVLRSEITIGASPSGKLSSIPFRGQNSMGVSGLGQLSMGGVSGSTTLGVVATGELLVGP